MGPLPPPPGPLAPGPLAPGIPAAPATLMGTVLNSLKRSFGVAAKTTGNPLMNLGTLIAAGGATGAVIYAGLDPKTYNEAITITIAGALLVGAGTALDRLGDRLTA